MNSLSLKKPHIDVVSNKAFAEKGVVVHVLRLDVVHPVVSGNKWYKLKKYLAAAKGKIILTFGGAYSNHIAAAAAACAAAQLQCIGIIRGEKGKVASATLAYAAQLGMPLYYTSREAHKRKELPDEVVQQYPAAALYVINEGGYGLKGAEGARTILEETTTEHYTHICAATGTGTTLAGLINGATGKQKVLGITVLKNNYSIEREIAALAPTFGERSEIRYDYHFGGYAKYTAGLIRFMNDWYRQTGIPSDFVYTGKVFYAVADLIAKNYFPTGSRVLIIHSGGLQGNATLPKETLIY